MESVIGSMERQQGAEPRPDSGLFMNSHSIQPPRLVLPLARALVGVRRGFDTAFRKSEFPHRKLAFANACALWFRCLVQ